LKLLVLSDLHGSRDAVLWAVDAARVHAVDAILVCGDVTHFGDTAEAGDLLKPLAARSPTLFIPGNCDSEALASIPVLAGAVNLHGRCHRVREAAFLGVGGSSPTPFHSSYELAEAQIGEAAAAAFTQLDRDAFTFLCHSPPVKTRVDVTRGGVHAGSSAVRRFIEDRQPILVACGHIHEAQGVDRIGRSVILNPGPAAHRQYALATLGDEAAVRLATFE
jgi:Icc-related predicted phosphoesterase